MECGKRMYPLTAADYKLLEEIGQGVSATVYRAICLPFKEVVAIKALDLEKCNSNLDEIRREAVTMSLINHPNVVKAHCSFVVEQTLWVVMPYMAGGSCLHIMKSAFVDGFDEPVIATLLKEVLKALEYLHRHGHIHRDVKAGNILVDGNGAVKLGDFGVAACMFDTGDRQRSRKTFVGTPCWMAPEVMEQLHGYDFKADIWSFGITALELAHGHAPFSKYPPMKVLLMTLQNAPPGLDYERDKRFSKSFKEMIAMCLVKDPHKRPTAEKLLRHSFFKHARTPDYICRQVLEGLPSLGERIKILKNADAARVAQQNLNFDEQEARSQTEYKRGVSAWNFDMEDLKAQSALIPDDDDSPPQTVKEDPESSSHFYSPQPVHRNSGYSPDRAQPPVAANGNGGNLTGSRNLYSSNPAVSSVGVSGRREPMHKGRFDVFEDDDILESPGWHGPSAVREQSRKEREERDHRRFDDRERDESRRGFSGPLVPERVLSSVRGRDDDQDREHRHGRVSDRGCFSGPLLPTGERDHRPANGVPKSSPVTDSLEDKSKGPIQKAPIVQKGRFSVTSDDEVLEDLPHVSSRRNMCPHGSQLHLHAQATSSSHLNGVSVSAVAIVPHLQNALQLAVMQQDALMQILNGINLSESTNSPLRSPNSMKRNSSVDGGSEYLMVGLQSDKEREYLHQIADLQSRLSQLLEEQQVMKMRNVALERQLNTIYNKEEEERIRREEAAKQL